MKIKLDISKRNPMKGVPREAPIRKALKIFATTGVHRVCIIKPGHKEKILNILTQSAVIEWLQLYMNHPKLINVLKQTVKELDIGTKKIHSIKNTDTALTGFKLMASYRINGVPIVDENDKFVGALSAKSLKVNLFTFFFIPNFKKKLNRDLEKKFYLQD